MYEGERGKKFSVSLSDLCAQQIDAGIDCRVVQYVFALFKYFVTPCRGDTLRTMEPMLRKEVSAALFCPRDGVSQSFPDYSRLY